MTKLVIADLTERKEMDRAAMAAVHGGTRRYVAYPWMPSYSVYKSDVSFSAQQGISQVQDTLNNNGNNVAFAHGIRSTVKPQQHATNNISLGGLLPH
jgi:hypothetical protein